MNHVPTSIAKRRRRIGVVSFASLVTVAALAYPRSDEPGPVSTDGAEQATSGPFVHAQPRSLSATDAGEPCSFVPGQRMSFSVESHTAMDIDLAVVVAAAGLAGGGVQAQAQAQRSTVDRKWQLDLEAVDQTEDGAAIVAARILDRGIQAHTESGEQPHSSPRLSDTFLIVIDPRCAIQQFGWRTMGDLDAAREQQQLVAALGFWAPPSEQRAKQWTGSSFDGSGDYDARYHVTGDGDIAGEITNFRTPQDSSEDSSGALRFDMRVRSSGITVELADASWFGSLHNHRELELLFADALVGTHTQRTDAQAIAAGTWQAYVDLDEGWSFGRLTSGSAEASFDPAFVGIELDDALARYRELLAAGASLTEYSAYLREWLRANPEGASQLLEQLAAGAFDSQLARAGVFHALGTAGTPEARRALLDIVDGATGSAAHRISAAQALAQVEQPDLDMVAMLAKQAHDGELQAIERGSIGLALGAFAHEAEARDPVVAAAARDEIRSWLEQPGDTEQLRHSLLAAGNAGHDDLVEAVAPYLGHDDAQVRESAARAMRGASPELAYPQLERVSTDVDQVVRAQALASATQVSARANTLPSEALLGAAERALVGGALEQRNAVALLGAASARGSGRARASLDARLQAELASESPDPELLAALGRTLPSTWTASN